MHGIVFSELKKFVDKNYGINIWPVLLSASGLNGKAYQPNLPYPDVELIEIVRQACILTELPKDSLLEAFGKFIVPDLIAVFKYTINSSWKTLDLIENVETVIHKAVRLNNKGAQPPKLKVSRVSANLIEILYQSPRKMEHLGVGIIKGIAEHYNEKVHVNFRALTTETSVITVKV
jgi:hypothetical protein